MLLRIEAMSPLAWVRNAFDIAIVTYLFYRILLLIRHTRAFQVVKGIVLLVLAGEGASLAGLSALHDVLQTAQVALLVAIPVVFQPELRAALERLGRARILVRKDETRQQWWNGADAVARAAFQLSRAGLGALMVLERRTGLSDMVESGVRVDAAASWRLLVALFSPPSPLHDGAVILRGGRILAAGCVLPLAALTVVALDYGTRHRAAVGVTEASDALAVVVSEETGAVSLAQAGALVRHLDEGRLRELLRSSPSGAGPDGGQGGEDSG